MTHPSVRFRQLVENALTHLTWFEEACRELGLTGISQVWDEEPAWYFWLEGRAYLLRYAGVEESGAELTGVLHAFPTAAERGKDRYGDAERALLTERYFDFSTMTPRYESFARFTDAFVIGELVVWPAAEDLELLVVSSREGDWEAAWRFTEFFVSMLTFFRKTGPVAAPFRFSPQAGITSVMVPFDQAGSCTVEAATGSCPGRRLAPPAPWDRLARHEIRCSAAGTCACGH